MRWLSFGMMRRNASSSVEEPARGSKRSWRRVWLGLLLFVALLALGTGLLTGPYQDFVAATKTSPVPSIYDGARLVAPGTPLSFTLPTMGQRVNSVQLFEAPRNLGVPGQTASIEWQDEVALPAVVTGLNEATGPESLSKVTVTGEDGARLLNADASYRLVVEGERLDLRFPLPTWEPWRYEYSFQTALSPVPIDLPSSYTLGAGDILDVKWSMPITGATCAVGGGVVCDCEVSATDDRLLHVSLQNYEQGMSYQVMLTGAQGANGVALAQPSSFLVVTPPSIGVEAVSPDHESFGHDPTISATITFSEPIEDRARAESAISFEPSVSGTFQWSEDGKTVEFTPNEGFPWETEIIARVAAGQEVRGISGGYLENPTEWSFNIRPNKIIDVDLSRQVVTAIEGGQVAMTMLTGTGVPGGETPTGTFMVQYKVESCRMAGVNPSGSYYDIPNVPWVMPFWGDYTIHGAPWRSTFGVPGSAGCVSLAVPDAERLFYWTPVGTRIEIHY